MNFAKRVQSEYKKVKENPIDGITMHPTELSLYEWDCSIRAPEDSPYYNSIFEVKLYLPENYPLQAPKAKFVTRIFHPNIHYSTGEVCLDILKSKWTPVWNLEVLLLFMYYFIECLLSNPSSSFESCSR